MFPQQHEMSFFKKREVEFSFDLNIITLAGQNLTIKAFKSDTVSDVKRLIETMHGIPAESQILISRNEVLEDETVLEEQSIDGNSSISLVIKMQNGTRFGYNSGPGGKGGSYILLCKRDSRYFILELVMMNDKFVLKSIKPFKSAEQAGSLMLQEEKEEAVSFGSNAPLTPPMQLPQIQSQSKEFMMKSGRKFYQANNSLSSIYDPPLSNSTPKYPALTAPLPPIMPTMNGGGSNKCNFCSKRLGLTNSYKCKCGGLFCPKHRFNDQHKCSFDFRLDGKMKQK